jgi:hypothetical protein
MIGFLIKKTFFDLWDNMFRIIFVNLGFIAVAVIPVFLPGLFAAYPLVSILVLVLGIFLCSIYFSAAALSVKAISDYGSFGFLDFMRNLKEGISAGLFMGFALLVIFAMGAIIIPFYLGMDASPLTGLFLAAIIFWTAVALILCMQFFFAVRARLDSKISKVIVKSFIIVIDNPGFAVFAFLNNIVLAMLWLLLLPLIFPGPAGIILFLDEALRLRLLKYDWLEANPEFAASPKKRKKIPWDAILIEEREKTGTRTFKNFIFPWKY